MKFVFILAIFLIIYAKAATLRISAPYDYETGQRRGSRQMNPCRLPKDPGMGYAYIPSYYFNAQEGVCLPFIYGGMRGNANRFTTLNECETACLMH